MFFYSWFNRSSASTDDDDCGDFCEVASSVNFETLLESARQQLDDMKDDTCEVDVSAREPAVCWNRSQAANTLNVSSHHSVVRLKTIPFQELDLQWESTEESEEDDEVVVEAFDPKAVPWVSPLGNSESQGEASIDRAQEDLAINLSVPHLITFDTDQAPLIDHESLLIGDPTEYLKLAKRTMWLDTDLQVLATKFDRLLASHFKSAAAESCNEEQALIDFMKKHPLVLQVIYHFEAFEHSCWPLHYFAVTSSIRALNMAYNIFPEAIGMTDSFRDTALHHSSSVHASVSVLQFLLDRFPEAAKHTNDSHQTALHSAFVVGLPPMEMVQLLLKAYPTSTQLVDSDGNTPLHLCLRHNPTLEMVQQLSGPCKMPILTTGNRSLDKPLHMACRYGASDEVVAWLLIQFPYAARVTNEHFVTPLHLCVRHENWHMIAMLVKQYPDAKFMGDLRDETPYDIAKKKGSPEEILDLLS